MSIYNTNRTINYYTSNYYSINYYSNKLLISLIQIDGCCNLEKKISVSVSLLVLSDFILSTFCIPHRGQSVSLVCKPNQITEVCVIPMIQKVSNCGKYWVEIELARNKMKSTQKQTSKGVKIKLINIRIKNHKNHKK